MTRMCTVGKKFVTMFVFISIASVLFSQHSLAPHLKQEIDNQFNKQKGESAIVIVFYTSSDYEAGLYGEYIGWKAVKLGYDINTMEFYEEAGGIAVFFKKLKK